MKHCRAEKLVAVGLALSALQLAPAIAQSYSPRIDPANFTAVINNPFFTLTPGTSYTYKSSGRKGTEITKTIVTDQIRKVMGVTTHVVWDRVWLNNQLIEETYDWYAQDKEGNVWYFGEDSTEFENRKKPNKKGSWEAGVSGAQPGIVMQAKPHPGESYRQEYLEGEAEDMAEVVSLDESVTVPYGSFKDCLKTKDWSAIEPGSVEHKYYSKEVGNVVLETEGGDKKRVELIEITKAR